MVQENTSYNTVVIESILIKAFEAIKAGNEEVKEEILSDISEISKSQLPNRYKKEANMAKSLLTEGFAGIINLLKTDKNNKNDKNDKDNETYEDIFKNLPEFTRYEMLLRACNDIDNMNYEQLSLLKGQLEKLESSLIYSGEKISPKQLIANVNGAMVVRLENKINKETSLKSLNRFYNIYVSKFPEIKDIILDRFNEIISTTDNINFKEIPQKILIGLLKKYNDYNYTPIQMKNIIEHLKKNSIRYLIKIKDPFLTDAILKSFNIGQLFKLYSETDNIVFQECILKNVEMNIKTNVFGNKDLSGKVFKKEDSIFKQIKTALKKNDESKRYKVLKNIFNSQLDDEYSILKIKIENLLSNLDESETSDKKFIENTLNIINYKMYSFDLQKAHRESSAREARKRLMEQFVCGDNTQSKVKQYA